MLEIGSDLHAYLIFLCYLVLQSFAHVPYHLWLLLFHVLQGQQVTLLFSRSFANLLLLSYRAIPQHTFLLPLHLACVISSRQKSTLSAEKYSPTTLQHLASVNPPISRRWQLGHETKVEKASAYPDLRDGSTSPPGKLLAVVSMRLGEEEMVMSACILSVWGRKSPRTIEDCLVLYAYVFNLVPKSLSLGVIL